MLTVAGVGPGNPKYLTVDLVEKIKDYEYVLAFKRIGESLKSIRGDIEIVDRVDEVLKYIEKDKEVLLLASGDPCFFGIVDFLKRKNIEIREVLPGLSSFQYLMSKLKKPWESAHFLSLHGRDGDLEIIRDKSLSILLTDKEKTASYISRELGRLNIRGSIYVAFNLSYEDEVIRKIRIGEEIEDISPLAVVVVENEMD